MISHFVRDDKGEDGLCFDDAVVVLIWIPAFTLSFRKEREQLVVRSFSAGGTGGIP